MNEAFGFLGGLLTEDQWLSAARALVLVVGGLVAARFVSGAVDRALRHRYEPQERMLARRVVTALIVGLTLASALHQLGFRIDVLLGAAGVLTVAVGFASQTSVSNLISGLFLIAERPFVVGDAITVDGETGEVLSIDLLSTKLRTFDNLLIRVPNERIIKSTVKNLSRFPIRRVELPISVARDEDLEQVRAILLEATERHPFCLEEPKAIVLFQGFGESSIDLQLNVWTLRQNILAVKTEIPLRIKERFEESGVEVPYPHRILLMHGAPDPDESGGI